MSGSTNNKIKNNNKQVQKQYESDKAFWEYQNYENNRKYKDAVQRTELNQANADNQANFKDKINKQQYEYQEDIRRYQFGIEKDAYKRSLKDYDKQVELNSMSGALAEEAANRTLDEQLIQKNFGLEDQDIILDKSRSTRDYTLASSNIQRDKAESDKDFAIDANKRKVSFARDNKKLDKNENREQRQYLKDIASKDIEKTKLRDDRFDEDNQYIKDKSGWDKTKADYTYNKFQASNFVNRIDALVKQKRSIGTIRASGREGNSATAEVQNALAEYGRSQAALVDSLVFAKDDKLLAKAEIEGTKNYQVAGKDIDKKLNQVDRQKIVSTRDRSVDTLKYKDSKLDKAFDEIKADAEASTEKLRKDFGFTASQIKLDQTKTRSDFKFNKKEIQQSRKKIRTTYDSAKLQYKANIGKIKLDEYAANLAAQGRVLAKPEVPPALPKPLATPRVNLPMPLEPTKSPKPIKGAIGKTSVWNDIGDGLNVGLQIAGLFI